MHRDISMPLLKSVVLLDVVKVVSPDDYCPLHLLIFHNPSQDSSTDTHIAGKRALFVNVCPFNSLQQKHAMTAMGKLTLELRII